MKTTRPLRIAIVHQLVNSGAVAAEEDVLRQVAAVEAALARNGHHVRVWALGLDLERLERHLDAWPPDVVFNLVESLGGHDRLLPFVPALLESRGISHTGNAHGALALTTCKPLTKQLLRAAALPTPDWIDSTGRLHGGDNGPRDWLLKSGWDHASCGVSGDNLIENVRAEVVRERLLDFPESVAGDWFAEAYIAGREFNLGLLPAGEEGLTTLPVAEIRFVDFPPGMPHILDYEAKWNPEAFAYRHTPRRFDLPSGDHALAEELRLLALACGRVCGLTSYARVDFRVDDFGRPWILEINANPCLAPDAGYAAALAQAGVTFDTAMEHIVQAALTGPASGSKRPRQAAGSGGSSPGHGLPPIDGFVYRRDPRAEDVEAVRGLVESTGFFSPAEVDMAADLVRQRLKFGPAADYEFLLAEDSKGSLAAYSCFGPVPCTEGSFDLYWIAVNPGFQGGGLGRDVARRTEEIVRSMGGRRLYAETSGRPQYARTRAFYEKNGYRRASLLENFYARGDDRVTYVKEFEGRGSRVEG